MFLFLKKKKKNRLDDAASKNVNVHTKPLKTLQYLFQAYVALLSLHPEGRRRTPARRKQRLANMA